MFKSLLQLSAASFVAQIISLIVMPIITRLHTPVSLGEFQFFTTVALVLAPLVSGGLHFSIKTAENNSVAVKRLRLALQYSLLVFLMLLVSLPLLLYLLKKTQLNWFSNYLALLFIFVYLSASFQSAIAFMVFHRRYKLQANYTISRSIIFNTSKVGLSCLSSVGYSLVFALILTEVIQLLSISKGEVRLIIKRMRWKWFLDQLYKLRIYPTYVTFASVVGIMMNWFPILVVGALYGPEFAGLLGLAIMVVNTPVFPIVSALQSICFGELAKNRSENNVLYVYGKVMLIAVFPAIAGVIVLGLAGEKLFSLIFGEAWSLAGQYAFICFIPMSLSLVLSPVYSTINHFFGFQKTVFWIQITSLIICILSVYAIATVGADVKVLLYAFAVIVGITHVLLFCVSSFLYFRKKGKPSLAGSETS